MIVDWRAISEELVAISIKSPDFAETQKFKKRLQASVFARKPAYLNSSELDQIIAWKLDSQYPRSRALRSMNLDNVVVPVTRACLEVVSPDSPYEIELKIRILSTLRGIATPLASAVLAILEPNKYAVIDTLLWEFFMGQEKQAFSTTEYQLFLANVKELSGLTGLSMQETEHALWIYLTTK
jgi:hypothetical protein